MLSLNQLDSYAKRYLISWEQKSTVRTQQRSRLDKNSISKIEFKFPIKPYLDYAEIKALTHNQLHPFYMQSLCDMLSGVAHIETDLVADQCTKLANRDLGFELSNSIKQVAITIATDEFYHAYVAREMLDDIEMLTGYIPSEKKKAKVRSVPSEPSMNKPELLPRQSPIEYFTLSLPASLHGIASTVWLCILENIVAEDFFVLAKNFQDDNPFSIYNREHLHDEGRHRVFFQKLLEYLWSVITENDRVILGQAIVGYINQFHSRKSLEKQTQLNINLLSKLNLPDSAIQFIAYDVALIQNSIPYYECDSIKPVMTLMEIAGITDHGPTRELFSEKELIKPQLACV